MNLVFSLGFLQRWILWQCLPPFPQKACWLSKLPRFLLTHHLERAVSTTSFLKTDRKSLVPETPVLALPCSLPNPWASLIPGYITIDELIDLVWLKCWGSGWIDQIPWIVLVVGFSARWRNWQVMLHCIRPKMLEVFLSLPFLSWWKCCTFYSCKINKRGHNISLCILSCR